jgi:AcrR family transcriptional regulator
MGRRAYDRTLRDAQAGQTRERILDAVIAALARREELSPPDVAKAAGVSVPTVYRHFPSREHLMEAAQEALGARLERPSWPRTTEEMIRRVPDRFAWLEANGVLMRAILSSALGREILSAVRESREKAIARSVDAQVAHLSPARRRAVVAILSLVDDAHAWQELRDEWRLPLSDAAWAAEWALQALLERLDTDAKNAKKPKKPTKPKKSKPVTRRGRRS